MATLYRSGSNHDSQYFNVFVGMQSLVAPAKSAGNKCDHKGASCKGVCTVFADPTYDLIHASKKTSEQKQADADLIASCNFNWRQAAIDAIERISAKYPSNLPKPIDKR